MDFIDPNMPLATCVSETCDSCTTGDKIHCHFSRKDLIHFLLTAFPGFFVGGVGICHFSGWMIMPWLFALVGFFGFIEIRVMCSHCPHYAEAPGTLKCWANYGSPKIWKYRPGPMSVAEHVVFFSGLALVWGYPLYPLMAGSQWTLLIVYIATVAGFFTTLRMFLCTQCMNFACPLNNVAEPVRNDFFKRNPAVARAWDRDIDCP